MTASKSARRAAPPTASPATVPTAAPVAATPAATPPPAPAAAPEQQPELELKRLTPVVGAAASAATLAGRLYVSSKAYVPERLQGTVAAAEGKVAELATPYLPTLLDKGTSVLQAVDQKVDSTILSAWSSYTSHAEALTAAVAQQKAARQAYLQRVEESVAFVREQGLQGATKAAADALQSRVEEAKKVPTVLIGEISEAWTKFVHTPAVERLLAASRGQVEAAYARYMAAHDALVADPRYSAALAKSGELLAAVQGTGAYQAAAARLAPLLMPYADQAGKLAAPYLQAVASHLAPVPAA
ncbi:hypothetical protein COHA_000655 [Chlorella ohadii]|uniref:Uncharacterized protein n=1 Tax=Chlorella ohadii TaxID=2649997 RepID=A0AAD5E0J7_9CHLO|nr:hypothetical protein COHA_000655 [Chlorella ohadii]